MSLMTALLETYDFAKDMGLVDNPDIGTDGQTILPVYHSSKRAANSEDIFEITLNHKGDAIDGAFLEKDTIIVFPITEDSITRSGAKEAPHAISDELSYLGKGISPSKNEAYIKGIENLLEYEMINPCKSFKLLANYIQKNTILDDFKRFFLKGKEHSIDSKFRLTYEEVDPKGRARKKNINLPKIFITFRIEREEGPDITLTRDQEMHNFFISYIRGINSDSKEMSSCNVTGKLGYCSERHRGLLGTAKLISISNHNENYYGRIKKGGDICHVSYEASQKIHNMLKYLIENSDHGRYIGEGAYLINWLSNDLEKGGVELVSDLGYEEDEDDLEDLEEVTADIIGGRVSEALKKYFLGEGDGFKGQGKFYVLIIEKISNGRLSVKYFRELSRSEAYGRVTDWYESTMWRFYDRDKSPSLYEIVNFVYGQENRQGYLSCENKKLSRSTVERLIPCVIDGQRFPRDISRRAFYKLSKKQSYKKSWNRALNIGCALFKKQKSDFDNYLIDVDRISEVNQLKESKSFYYGKLMAIYEKIEQDAVMGRRGKGDKGATQRITNSDRLWNAMIRTPERTRFVLESKIKPYINILKRNSYGSYVFYDKLITGITMDLLDLKDGAGRQQGSLDEDFILGYYYQKSDFYKKRDKTEEISGTVSAEG